MKREVYDMKFGGTCPYCIRDGKRGQYKKRFKTLWRLKFHCVFNHPNENYMEVIEKLARELIGVIRIG